MNAYKSAAPRATFAIAAVAMTAITMALSIMVPASVDSSASRSSALALSSVPAVTAAAAATYGTRSDMLVVNAAAPSVKPATSNTVRCPDSA